MSFKNISNTSIGDVVANIESDDSRILEGLKRIDEGVKNIQINPHVDVHVPKIEIEPLKIAIEIPKFAIEAPKIEIPEICSQNYIHLDPKPHNRAIIIASLIISMAIVISSDSFLKLMTDLMNWLNS